MEGIIVRLWEIHYFRDLQQTETHGSFKSWHLTLCWEETHLYIYDNCHRSIVLSLGISHPANVNVNVNHLLSQINCFYENVALGKGV